MENRLTNQFGKRTPSTIAPTGAHPVKRSRHVALLLMGTLAVGGGAFAMIGRENCAAKGGGTAASSVPQAGECQHGSSSGYGGSWSRRNFFGTDATSTRSSSSTSSEAGSGETTRGGFGSFARSLGLHFSGT